MLKLDESVAFRMLLGRRISQFREKHKLTRQALADLLPGVSAQMLMNAEEGNSVPAGLALIRVVRIADLTAEELARYPLSGKSLLRAARQVRLSGDTGAVMNIGPLLLARRAMTGQTQQEVAATLGLSLTTYRRLEVNIPPERLDIRLVVASYLDLPLGAVASLRAISRTSAKACAD